jgi:hypothetical protein
MDMELSEDEDVMGGGVDFGNVAHQFLADLPFFPDCGSHLDDYLSSDHRYHIQTARERLERIHRNYERLGFDGSKDIRTEVPWVLTLPVDEERSVMLRGVVDRLHRSDRGWVLLDYKTGKIDDEKRDRYFRQLNLYRLAAESGIFPGVTAPQVILVEIEHGNIIEVPEGPNLKQDILAVAQAVFSGDYSLPKSRELCADCPYSNRDQEEVVPCDPRKVEGYYAYVRS